MMAQYQCLACGSILEGVERASQHMFHEHQGKAKFKMVERSDRSEV